jgi:uncharacterized protein YndB with AHSA1/START domain
MKTKLQFDFLVDKEKNSMTIIKEFDAKRQLVWDCHTKSELLDQWFAPKPYSTKSKSMNFKDGGHWQYAMIDPDGLEHWGRMDFQKIKPIDNYTALSGFCDASGSLIAGLPLAQWNVTFSERQERTLVNNTITYETAEALQQVIDMGMQEGISASVEQLAELVLKLK